MLILIIYDSNLGKGLIDLINQIYKFSNWNVATFESNKTKYNEDTHTMII